MLQEVIGKITSQILRKKFVLQAAGHKRENHWKPREEREHQTGTSVSRNSKLSIRTKKPSGANDNTRVS